MNLEKWKKFFCDSGIPASEASTYAFKFYQNRIKTNMLVDLNKDYLKEMGITIMGDVIAILRHAKQVYEEIQKTGKTESLEEAKDKRSEKEISTKIAKKLPNDVNVKIETSVPKSVSRSTVKRKSELTMPIKKSMEPPKKPKLPVNDDNIEECEDLGYVMIDPTKKALLFNQKMPVSMETQLKNLNVEKPEKTDIDPDLFNMSEDDDDDDDNVEVIINDPIVTPFSGYKKFPLQDSNYVRFKEFSKSGGQESNKRTVFKRLGEDISQHSVSSTTTFEDDEQFSLLSKKAKEEAVKVTQEKQNSVFHRLGQKCDVSSTSVDEKQSTEEKKPIIKSDSRDNVTKLNLSVSASKVIRSRKIKTKTDDEDPDSCLPSCVKYTFSEGILASSGNARKRTLKERLGLLQGTPRTNLATFPAVDYTAELRLRKYTSNDSYQKEKIFSASSKKRVSFGTVSEKLIPSREEAIRNGELSIAYERMSVFDRLGFNRTY